MYDYNIMRCCLFWLKIVLQIYMSNRRTCPKVEHYLTGGYVLQEEMFLRSICLMGGNVLLDDMSNGRAYLTAVHVLWEEKSY